MLQVHVEPVVPIVLGDLVDLVAIVVGGIVDQHVERRRRRSTRSRDQPAASPAMSLRSTLHEPRAGALGKRVAILSVQMSMNVTSQPCARERLDDARRRCPSRRR